jgi:hypothetical protein
MRSERRLHALSRRAQYLTALLPMLPTFCIIGKRSIRLRCISVFIATVLFAWCTTASAQAQESRRPADRIPFTYSIAYFGEFALHPGIEAELQYPLIHRGRSYAFVAAALGGYYHPRFATGVFLNGQLGYRLALPWGFFLDGRLGAGYLHTFLGAPVYDSDGNLLPSLGLPSVMPLASIGIGYSFTRAQTAPSVFTRIVAFGQYPFNGTILPHLGVVIGIEFSRRK